MRTYYPGLLTGSLPWSYQKRFFECLHDTIELFVHKDIFTHDPDRDHFTRTEIFRMFNIYYEYDEETSAQLRNIVFAFKKILIGGSVDQLKDKELLTLSHLINDYKEIYFILHKAIPIFLKAFSEDSLTPKEKDKALDQVRKAMVLLNQAYQRENIVYPIEDIYKYAEYLYEAQLISEEAFPLFQKGFLFLHNLLEGLFAPKKQIEGKDWDKFFRALYKNIELFLHYKTYFDGNISSGVYTYRIIESLEIFISLLQIREPKGYPLKNLDEMLSIFMSFFDTNSSSAAGKIFASLQRPQAIPLLTRMFFCFSLTDSDSQKECQSHWERGDSPSIVTISFKDSEFKIFSDKIERKQLSESPFIIGSDKLNRLRDWLLDYGQGILKIYSDQFQETARQYLFDHWLNPFFGWEEWSSRIKFGSLHTEDQKEKAVQILSYQMFLSLLFSSYAPEGFFSSDKGDRVSIPLPTWEDMAEDMTPAFFVLSGEESYDSSWRASLESLFSFADSFLYSSNQDDLLEAGELIDLTVHLLESVKTEQIAYNKIFKSCGEDPSIDCIVEVILSDQDVLSAYPRFQSHLFRTQMRKYTERIKSILEGQKNSKNRTVSLLPIFLLIQAIELNYALIDKDQSFQLDSDELLSVAKDFEELIMKIPQVANNSQARAYLMYSFKTGYIPFYTGEKWTPLEFVHWYFQHKNRETYEAFRVSPNQFHHLLFDFYRLYQKYEGL